MAYTNTFANVSAATGAQLDQNLNQAGKLGVLRASISGTNTLSLTLTTNIQPTISAYEDGLRIGGVAAGTNSTVVTAQVGSLTALNVYKDSPAGPVVLTGGEIIQNNAITLVYDSTLNSGAGGFHLISNTGYAGGTVSSMFVSTLNGSIASFATVTGASLGSFATVMASALGSVTKLMVGASAASVTRVLSTLSSVAFTVVPTVSSQDQNFSLPGVQVNDSIQLGLPSSLTAGLMFNGYVPAAGTVAIRAGNITAASIAAFTLASLRVTATGFN